MAQWNQAFTDIVKQLDSEYTDPSTFNDILLSMLKSWMNEDGALVFVTLVPGSSTFHSDFVFVSKEVLKELKWTFSEWEDGTAALGIFTEKERDILNLHLERRSVLPIIMHVRKKNMPPHQEGAEYIFYFRYDFPHNMRIAVAVPE